MIPLSLSEPKESETFARDTSKPEVHDQERAIQVVVVLTINYDPRLAVIGDFDYPRLEMKPSTPTSTRLQ